MMFTGNDLNKTLWVKKDEIEKNRKWFIVDAKGKTLGRLATIIAKRLMGKDNVYYNDFWDSGDYVVVVNAKDISVTGNKLLDKIYYSHSGYKGHLKMTTLKELLNKKPEKALWFAVRGMLPKNKLREKRMKRLKIFASTTDKYSNLNLQQIEANV